MRSASERINYLVLSLQVVEKIKISISYRNVSFASFFQCIAIDDFELVFHYFFFSPCFDE